MTMSLSPTLTPELVFLSGLRVPNHKHEEDVGKDEREGSPGHRSAGSDLLGDTGASPSGFYHGLF